VLREHGRYYLAQYAIENPKAPAWQREARARQEEKVAAQPALYGRPVFTSFGPPDHLAIAPAGSADLVLTFRNVHNWSSQKSDAAAFEAFFAALKPGGILGVVEHRAKPGTPFRSHGEDRLHDRSPCDRIGGQAGFRLVEKAEINANPLDSTDHPNGVWTLPPVMRGPARSGKISGDRRKRPHDAEVPQAGVNRPCPSRRSTLHSSV